MSLRPTYRNRTSVSGSLTGSFVSSRPLISAEERRVGADPERQRHDHDRGPALGLKQHADAVAEIFEHC